mgnify:CR=1 FL=1
MAKKRVEDLDENVLGDNLSLDTGAETIIPTAQDRFMQQQASAYVEPQPVKKAVKESDNEPINCLRNERVEVRFVPKETALVNDPKHVLYGGMADTATRTFVVPRLASTGQYKNILTNNEKAYLEKVMGLQEDALSIYNRVNNFWSDSNPEGIGKVTLHKYGNFLDLSVPSDYIKYKILLANKDYIASSLQELEDNPKATYQYVIVSESAETESNLVKADAHMKCYMEYGKVENDFDTLKTIIELLEGRPINKGVKLDYLKGEIIKWISKDARTFLKVITDELLPAKVLIRRCVEAGLIGKKNDTYYLAQDGSALCEMNEESTLTNAAKYITNIKRQALKYSLEAKLNIK